jgi:hypothetical protein
MLTKIWVSYLFSRATEKTLLMKNTNFSGVPRIITKRYAFAHVRRQGRVQGNAVPKVNAVMVHFLCLGNCQQQ